MTDLQRCIEAVYAAAIGAGRWEGVLEHLAHTFPGTKASISSEQPEPLKNLGVVSYGYEESLVRDYVDRYSKINPWTPHWRKLPLLTAAVSDDVLPSDEFRRHEFYRFIERVGDAESAAGIKLFESSNSFAALNLHYGRRQAPEYNVAIPAFLNALAPHLSLAIQLNARLGELSEPALTLERAVPQFQTPAFLVDHDGTLLEANSAGQDLLAEGQAARLQDGGRLWIVEDAGRAKLTAYLSPGGASNRPPRGAQRNSAWRMFEFSSIELDRRVAWMPTAKKWLLALYEPILAKPSIVTRAQRFGLTRQETKVAAAVVDGQRVDTIAVTLGISSATVRQHLKSIFTKTGAHRQPELIARLIASE